MKYIITIFLILLESTLVYQIKYLNIYTHKYLDSMDTFRDDSDSIESLIEMYLCIYAMSNSEDIYNSLNNIHTYL
jgi:hypothetical protein